LLKADNACYSYSETFSGYFSETHCIKQKQETENERISKFVKTRMSANATVMAALPNIGGALCSTLQFG